MLKTPVSVPLPRRLPPGRVLSGPEEGALKVPLMGTASEPWSCGFPEDGFCENIMVALSNRVVSIAIRLLFCMFTTLNPSF